MQKGGVMKRVLFVDGTVGFDPNRIKEKACGGILTSLSVIPKYLASKGYDVYVSSSYESKTDIDGVRYIGGKIEIPKWDIIVLNRNGVTNELVNYSHGIGARVIWWLHDLAAFSYLEDASYRRVDKVVALSHYCKMSFSDFYDIPEDKFVIIPNGVDKSIFYPGEYGDRKKHSMIMASALLKGVYPVFDTWTNVKRQFPDAEFMIYSNQALHDFENNAEQTQWLKDMENAGAKVQLPIPQGILADKMRRAWALLMPNSYPEICSNLLLQARACGLPVIASNIGSVGEFIENGRTGIITRHYPHDLGLWIKAYAEETIRLFMDEAKHREISEKAPQGVLSWDEIGERWHELIQKT
jgi:glycosyltransferase involved in cell wall biosynthesis